MSVPVVPSNNRATSFSAKDLLPLPPLANLSKSVELPAPPAPETLNATTQYNLPLPPGKRTLLDARLRDFYPNQTKNDRGETVLSNTHGGSLTLTGQGDWSFDADPGVKSGIKFITMSTQWPGTTPGAVNPSLWVGLGTKGGTEPEAIPPPLSETPPNLKGANADQSINLVGASVAGVVSSSSPLNIDLVQPSGGWLHYSAQKWTDPANNQVTLNKFQAEASVVLPDNSNGHQLGARGGFYALTSNNGEVHRGGVNVVVDNNKTTPWASGRYEYLSDTGQNNNFKWTARVGANLNPEAGSGFWSLVGFGTQLPYRSPTLPNTSDDIKWGASANFASQATPTGQQTSLGTNVYLTEKNATLNVGFNSVHFPGGQTRQQVTYNALWRIKGDGLPPGSLQEPTGSPISLDIPEGRGGSSIFVSANGALTVGETGKRINAFNSDEKHNLTLAYSNGNALPGDISAASLRVSYDGDTKRVGAEAKAYVKVGDAVFASAGAKVTEGKLQVPVGVYWRVDPNAYVGVETNLLNPDLQVKVNFRI